MKTRILLCFLMYLVCCIGQPAFGQLSYHNPSTSASGLGFEANTSILHTSAYTAPLLSGDPRNEFKIGYGLLSGAEIGVSLGHGVGTALGAVISLGIGDVVSIIVDGVPTNVTVTRIEDDSKYYGAAILNYNRGGRRASWGLQASYAPLIFKSIVYYSNGSVSTTEPYRVDLLQTYARFDYRYILRPKFQMYSGLMAGMLFELQGGGAVFAPHVNLFGFRFGQKSALYAELGIGLSSFISAGYSARF
jgi:hypothetical protein